MTPLNLFLLFLLPSSHYASTTWNGCGSEKIVSGQPTSVCVVLSDSTSWESSSPQNYARYQFTPVADTFARLSIADSWVGLRSDSNDLLLANYTNPSVHVESLTSLSYVKRYRGILDDTSNTEVTWPYMTAIVNVDMGEITGITWDDGCYFCEDSSCADNTYDFKGARVTDGKLADKNCYVRDEACKGEGGKIAENCPLSVYAVWTGTDANGKYLKSAEMRFSQYKSYSVMDFIKDSESKFEEAKDFANYYTRRFLGSTE